MTRAWPMAILFMLSVAAPARAQGVEVSLQVTVVVADASGPNASHHASMPPSRTVSEPVVAWLTPTGPAASIARPPDRSPHTFVLSQKHKQFTPHLLVVPTGSSVEFPNLDPFFHNVFSLFDGRRFDLGLYEAGSRRTVRFDHDGVSYIFCNIHPEMAAVIVSLGTPFYALSGPDGVFHLPNVPPGDYDLNLWSENVSSTDSATLKRRIHVTGQNLRIPPIVLRGAPPPRTHPNKFGEPYERTDRTPY